MPDSRKVFARLRYSCVTFDPVDIDGTLVVPCRETGQHTCSICCFCNPGERDNECSLYGYTASHLNGVCGNYGVVFKVVSDIIGE